MSAPSNSRQGRLGFAMPTITLIGYRGTGKTTVAALLAEALHAPWWDADVELETRLGCSISALIGTRGEDLFRTEESATLATLLDRTPGVLATGGGVVIRPENRSALAARGGLVVWLTATVEVVRRRLAIDPTTLSRRPALSGTDPLAEVAATMLQREPWYRATAAMAIDTSHISPAEISRRILDRLA